MENLQLPHAKLLYVVSELWKQKFINDNEKVSLKDDVRIFDVLEKFEQNSNENELKDNIIDLVRPKAAQNGFTVVIGKKNQEQPQDEVSSPLGNQLFERKKKHGGGHELHGLSNVLKPTTS